MNTLSLFFGCYFVWLCCLTCQLANALLSKSLPNGNITQTKIATLMSLKNQIRIGNGYTIIFCENLHLMRTSSHKKANWRDRWLLGEGIRLKPNPYYNMPTGSHIRLANIFTSAWVFSRHIARAFKSVHLRELLFSTPFGTTSTRSTFFAAYLLIKGN